MLAGLVVPVLLMADPVDKDAARLKAEAFFMKKNPSSARRAQVRQDISLALTNESFHVFNLGEDGGFVMIAGDDCAPDILGYSDSGSFDAENMPENLRAWLDGYAEQIAWMKENEASPDPSQGEENGGSSRSAANSWGGKPAIEPLLTSQWGQGDPYNRQTPTINEQHCKTGCVATAMAQVMYYWYKKIGYATWLIKSTPEYELSQIGRLGLSAPATFDWANMCDTYLGRDNRTETEKNAVAKLMKYCGYSVEMGYGLDSSGASPSNIALALTDMFGYKSARYIYREDYTYENWLDVIYTDLSAGRPVLYGGAHPKGGHRFVCDGYDKDDYFHFNWGYSGYNDGFFKPSLCNYTIEKAYCKNQSIVCCTHPTETVSLSIEPKRIDQGVFSVTSIDIPTLNEGESADIAITLYNNHGGALPYDCIIDIELASPSGDIITTGSAICEMESYSYKTLTIPVDIPYKSQCDVCVLNVVSRSNRGNQNLRSCNVSIGEALPNLKGKVQINETFAEPGDVLSLELTGKADKTEINKRHIRWQIASSDSKKAEWEDIPDATEEVYYPTLDQVGMYLRAVVKVDGYHGMLVSDSREVIKPTLEGTVILTRNDYFPFPGVTLYYALKGKVANIDPDLIRVQWDYGTLQQLLEGKYYHAIWNTNSYTLGASDAGNYFRVTITADGYRGLLHSEPILCDKKKCKAEVVPPAVTTSSNKVYVFNAQATQEYIILNYKKDIRMLTESDWMNAKTPAEGETMLNMGGTPTATYYVYTRVKETETTLAGTEVRRAAIYLGNGVDVDAIELSIYKGRSSAYVEQDDLGAYYLDAGGSDFYRITVTPHPKNADFQGIRGSKWLVKGYSRASQWGRYFSDRECTQIIDADTYYETVYFKPQDYMPINYMELRVEHTRGYNDIVTDAILVNVASNNGKYKIEQLYIDNVTVGKGATKEGEFATRPHKAVPGNMSAMKTDGEGTPPVFTFDTENKTFIVDATDATTGTYWFAIYANGAALNSIKVEVTAPAPEEIRILPEEFTLDCGEPLQLEAQLFPEGAEGEVTWSSSNTNVATVTSDGLVTFKDGADIGATAIITATVGELSASCELTVTGEEYPIYIAGKQVTSRNMDDLAAVVDEVNEASGRRKTSANDTMEIRFDGEVLWLKNIDIQSNSQEPALVLDKPGLTVVVEGECAISNYSGIGLKIAKGTKIMGDGMLSIYGDDAAILLESEGWDEYEYENISLEVSNVGLSLFATNYAIKGSEDNRCSVTLNNITGVWQGYAGIVDGLDGGLEMNSCHFGSPEGLKIIDGSVFDGEQPATFANIDHLTTFYEEFDNTPLIEQFYNVVDYAALGHYRLTHDCKWQTLCLPFDVDLFAGTPFEDATVMTLDTNGKNGFDEETGTLYLTFKSVTTTEAGKPYIVGFTSGDDCYQPILRAYFRSKTPQSVSAASDGLAEVKMVGTFTPVSFEEDYSGTFFIDGANDLYAATEWSYLNSFRAYFDVPSLHSGTATVKQIVVDFADAPDGIEDLKDFRDSKDLRDYYDLSGRKLSGKPTKAGLYIFGNRKVVIK